MAGPVKKSKKRPPGRPTANVIRLPAATVEEVADRIFANAKKPDPSIRVHNRPQN